ncbi:MAG: MlaD family protein [Crocinitomicaceae bacterium]
MRILIYCTILFLVLSSCKGESKAVYILFDNSEGLSTGQDVMLNGVSVGKVQSVDLTKENQVITTVELLNTVDFPKGTAFEIQSKDVFTKIIHVTLGESKTMIENGDTIQGILRDNPHQTPQETRSPELMNDVKEMLKN